MALTLRDSLIVLKGVSRTGTSSTLQCVSADGLRICFPSLKSCNLNAKRERRSQKSRIEWNLADLSLQRGNNSNKKELNGVAGKLKAYLQNVIVRLLHCCLNPYFNNCVVVEVAVEVAYVASLWWDNCDLRCLTWANGTSETRHRHLFRRDNGRNVTGDASQSWKV